jgi:hypothetical protein
MSAVAGGLTNAVHKEPRFRFGVTFDYRCPFARNLHEHVVVGLRAGAPWDVSFTAFSLHQVHVHPGELDVWDDPARAEDLLAMQVGIAVRDRWPERFPAVHIALFSARHDHGMDLRDEQVLRKILAEQHVDADAVLAGIAGGGPLASFRQEHEHAVARHRVFGVPTVVTNSRAVFIRVMDRPLGDASRAIETVDRLLELITGWPELNEFKFTTQMQDIPAYAGHGREKHAEYFAPEHDRGARP